MRSCDPGISEFTQPDTLIPDLYNPLDWNKYSYARRNPLKYNDPSGHNPECGPDGIYCDNDKDNDHDYDLPVNIWDKSTQASDNIIDDIIVWEGNREAPYNDSTKNCTVGIGHKLHSGACSAEELLLTFSPEQIQEWFEEDLAEAESDVRAMFQALDNEYRPELQPGNPFPITQVQFDALVSFTFNAGTGNLIDLVRGSISKESRVFDFKVFSHLMTTRYAQGGPGLVPRREAEVNLFIHGIYP